MDRGEPRVRARASSIHKEVLAHAGCGCFEAGGQCEYKVEAFVTVTSKDCAHLVVAKRGRILDINGGIKSAAKLLLQLVPSLIVSVRPSFVDDRSGEHECELERAQVTIRNGECGAEAASAIEGKRYIHRKLRAACVATVHALGPARGGGPSWCGDEHRRAARYNRSGNVHHSRRVGEPDQG
eukprot:769046-Prymnesium_polylepis.2